MKDWLVGIGLFGLFIGLPMFCWWQSLFETHWLWICGTFLPVIGLWAAFLVIAPDRTRKVACGLVLVGALSNFTAVAANDWRMPVDVAWIGDMQTSRHQPITAETNLVWLTDVIFACSIGDLFLFAGLIVGVGAWFYRWTNRYACAPFAPQYGQSVVGFLKLIHDPIVGDLATNEAHKCAVHAGRCGRLALRQDLLR